MVTEDGAVRCYYDLQGDFNEFSLGNVRDRFSSLSGEELGAS